MSEREKQRSYIDTHVWNLERWYRGACLQSKHRDSGVENGHVGRGKGRAGCIGRLGLTYSLLCVK